MKKISAPMQIDFPKGWEVVVSFETKKEALAFIREQTGKPPPGKKGGAWVQDNSTGSRRR